jgi:hypothetical protein
MTPNITIVRASAKDSHEVAEMAGELLKEIMDAIGVQAFILSSHFMWRACTLRQVI